MMFQFYFKSMGSSESLKILSQRKLTDVIERFADGTGLVRITFLSERGSQKMHCTMKGWSGRTIHASAASDNMYATVDAIAHKLESQLMRKKTRSQKRKERFPDYELSTSWEVETFEDDFEPGDEERGFALAH